MDKADIVQWSALKPSEVTSEQWEEVIDAWTNGLSDREAAFRASKKTGVLLTEAKLKAYVSESEGIGFIRDCLHNELLSKAKLNIKDSIERGNISTSKWFLERKAPNEFSSKSAVAFEGTVAELSIDEKKKQMDEFMEQFDEREDRAVLKVGEFPEGSDIPKIAIFKGKKDEQTT